MAATTSVPEQWKPLGRTYNTRYFLSSDDVVIVLPDQGLKDDGASARVNIDFQTGYARLLGRRCAVVVVLDSLTSQDSEARRYLNAPDPTFQICFALVGSTLFGRAVSSVFMGLHPPRVPTRMFGTFEEALTWIRQTARTR